jgi:hypothetical protein
MGIDLLEVSRPPNTDLNLFGIFLLLAVCFTLVQVIRLAMALWAFSRKREFLHDETIAMDLLVQAALKGRLKSAFRLSGGDAIIDRAAALFRVDCIETKFLYLWETCYAKVQSIKTLTCLTVMLSCLVTVRGIYNVCVALQHEESAGPAAIAGGVAETLMVLGAGLPVAAFLYVVSRRFEGTLARRRRDWNYNKARFKEELSSNLENRDVHHF